jgi:hypothetical protein
VSGQRVVLFVLGGVLAIALVTLALYFLTRQDSETEPKPVQPVANAPAPQLLGM